MKALLITFFVIMMTASLKGQTCSELIQYVKSNGYGTTYSSFNSDAISKVTFYQITVDYKIVYFAIVCFKQQYSTSCKEYIYQVHSGTKLNYALNYQNSAGKAFWEYIQPHNKNLGCGID